MASSGYLRVRVSLQEIKASLFNVPKSDLNQHMYVCVCVCVCRCCRPPGLWLMCGPVKPTLWTPLCMCVCVFCTYVIPRLFSPRIPFTTLLMKSHRKHRGGGGECVSVFVLFVHVCVPLVFLPSLLLSYGLNWGPKCPINGEPV